MINSIEQKKLRARFNPDGSLLRKHQLRMLEMLKYIDSVCKKHNIKYWLCSGTLIGAVRHGGFIPWDDDIDIAMPREDYERFFVEYPLHSSGKFKLLSYRDKSSIYPFFKVVDPRTVVFEKYVNPRYQTGVWVDIFPLDLLPANDRPFKTCNRYQMLYALATANPETATSATRKLIKKLTTPLFERIDIYAAAAKMDEVARNAGDEACTDRGMLLFGYGPRERRAILCPARLRRIPDVSLRRLYDPATCREADSARFRSLLET